jgi:hypothetical protein
MSYYHQNPDYDVYAYEYGNYGNHDNGYHNEYKQYASHSEPDHYHQDPSEPDFYECECDNTGPAEHGNDRNGYEPEELEYEQSGTDRAGYEHEWLEYEGGEPNGEDYEQERLEYERGELHRGEYEDAERENEVHEPQERGYNDALELEELKRMFNEQGHEPERFEHRDGQVYKHQRLEHGGYGVHEPEYELDHKPGRRETDSGIRAPHTAFANGRDNNGGVYAPAPTYTHSPTCQPRTHTPCTVRTRPV